MKKGFTLIELLAVIVILAIIALIAVPVVINIINDSKKSSEEQSVELYIDSVKKTISRKQLDDTSFNPTTCNIQDSGNLICGNIEVIIDMKGIKPSKGIIEIKDNKISYKNLLLNGTYFNRLAISVQDNNNNRKPDIGDKYTYKVNDTDTFNFYVLSFNEDDNTVNLIMDRNICNDGTVNYTEDNNYCRYVWHDGVSTNTYGPDTAMQELYNGTKYWGNVPDMIMNYTDESNATVEDKGYTNLEITGGVATIIGKPKTKITTIGTSSEPLKARLPKLNELISANCSVSNTGSCPVWLMGNMSYWNGQNNKYAMNNNTESYQEKIYGYWSISSASDFAYCVYSNGIIGQPMVTSNWYGIRPVITVPKSYLE